MTDSLLTIFIGWDEREQEAYEVCVKSLYENTDSVLNIIPIKKHELIRAGKYNRENDQAATDFAYTRFLVPYLCNFKGWALFIDCDFLFTKDVKELFDYADDKHSLMCVQHDYVPKASIKMDGQPQVAYPRKNWSSCVLWNCGHKHNRILTPYTVNTQTGAYLHRFKFTTDWAIGELPLEWNWLEGEYEKPDTPPAAIHFTNGGPWFENCQDVDYADLWRSYL